jgi:hypothetical protein
VVCAENLVEGLDVVGVGLEIQQRGLDAGYEFGDSAMNSPMRSPTLHLRRLGRDKPGAGLRKEASLPELYRRIYR